MGVDMGITIQICPECGGSLKVASGQAIDSGKLVWHRSSRCEQCKFATEEDGFGRDDDIRSEILETDGESILMVDDLHDRTRALAETRQSLEFGMAEVLQLRQIDFACVARGTNIEVEWLRQRLENKGIMAHIAK